MRFGDIMVLVRNSECPKNKPKPNYISGHIFLFDKWVEDSN